MMAEACSEALPMTGSITTLINVIGMFHSSAAPCGVNRVQEKADKSKRF